MLKNSVGNVIRAKRKELNLTQAQLAEAISSDEYYISAIETGRRKPGSKFLVALSNALGVSADSLLGFESKIVLHETVSEMEERLQKLSLDDREIVLDIFDRLIDRLTPRNNE